MGIFEESMGRSKLSELDGNCLLFGLSGGRKSNKLLIYILTMFGLTLIPRIVLGRLTRAVILAPVVGMLREEVVFIF